MFASDWLKDIVYKTSDNKNVSKVNTAWLFFYFNVKT